MILLRLITARTQPASSSFSADYLVVAGGGGGGNYAGGGGGGGGIISQSNVTSLSTGVAYSIIVGTGGTGAPAGGSVAGTNGANSVFNISTAVGGGRGGGNTWNGAIGGAGGGAGAFSGTAGSGTSGQGNAGGAIGNAGGTGSNLAGGGGGGTATNPGAGFNGGDGGTYSITGSSVVYAGGGGASGSSGSYGLGGAGGGGNGSVDANGNGQAGTDNLGGGGGGAWINGVGGKGGNGVVIIKIPNTHSADFTSGVIGSVSSAVSGFNIYSINATSDSLQTTTFSLGQTPVSDADAQAFIDAASIIVGIQKNAINQLVIDLKAANLWTKMTAIYPFVGGSATSTSYNLKNTAQYQITWNGTLTFNNNGVTGSGSGYGNFNLAPSQIGSQNDIHACFYSRTNSTENSWDLGVRDASGNSLVILPRYSGTFYMAANDNTFTNTASSDSRGLFVATRTGASACAGYRNGTLLVSGATTSTTPATINAFICATNNNGSPLAYSTKNYAFASFGSGLSAIETTNLYTAVQAYQTTLGRQV